MKKREYVNFNNILEKVSQEELYYRYCNIEVNKKVKHNFTRSNDTICSLKILPPVNGKLRWKDFGSGETGDVFDLISRKYNITTYQSLIQINKDYNLDFDIPYRTDLDIAIPIEQYNESIIEKYTQKQYEIGVILNKYNNIPIHTKDDLKYWKQGDITKEILQIEDVYSVANVLINNDIIWWYNKHNPIFLYLYGKEYKLYKPLERNKDNKWLGNFKCVAKAIGGLNRLMDTNYLIITKSKKDDMIIHYIFGLNSIHIQSESSNICDEIIADLKSKYTKIYNLFDNDDSGIELGGKFANKYGTTFIHYPKELNIKDSWDNKLMYKNNAKEHLINLL